MSEEKGSYLDHHHTDLYSSEDRSMLRDMEGCLQLLVLSLVGAAFWLATIITILEAS